MGQCKFCGKESDLRMGGCFDCAEAEAIIAEGLDMYDKGIGGEENVKAKYPGQKLKMLIDKGWVLLTLIQKKKLNIK